MKKYVYKIIVSDKGFDDFEAKVSEKLNDGWKPIGGLPSIIVTLIRPWQELSMTPKKKVIPTLNQ